VLVVNGGKDGELADEDEHGAADRDEDLAHDDVADIAVRLAEMNHQTEGESVEGHGDVEQPPVETRAADGVADDEQQHAGDDGEGVVDVARFGDGQVEDDLQEGLEVEVPGVVGDLVDHVQGAGADHGAVGQEVPWKPGLRGPVVFVDAEEDHHAEADDDHGDDPASGPALGLRGGEVEGQEEDHEAAREEEDAEDWAEALVLTRIENNDEVLDLLSNSTAMCLRVCVNVLPVLIVSAGMRPAFFALLRLTFNIVNRGIAMNGVMMAKVPNAHLQLPTLSSKAWAARGPAKAVIMYGEDVKAKAMPRFLRLVVSTATIT
jgi:hypothetical protein